MATFPQIGAQAVILGMSAFRANAKTVEAQMAAMGRSAFLLERTSTHAFSRLDKSHNVMVASVAAGTAIAAAALAAMGAAAVALGNKYAMEMAFIQGISEATTASMQQLDEAQLEMSRHSTQSALDLVMASSELVKAGFAIEKVTGVTLQAVNDLVVASKGELTAANAAILVQVALAGFGASAVEAADVATAAAQRSTLTFNGYADAIRQFGPVGAEMGFSLKEVGALIGTLGQQMTKGTDIGTALRVAFLRMQDPTSSAAKQMKKFGISLFDSEGNARPLLDVIKGIVKAFGPGSEAVNKYTKAEIERAKADIFGTKSVRAINALVKEGVAGYESMLEATNNLKTADLANTMLVPTAAKLKIVENNIVALGIAFQKGLDPYLNAAAGNMVKFMQSISLRSVSELARQIGHVAVNIGGILPILARFDQATQVLRTAALALGLALTVALAPAVWAAVVAFGAWAVASAAALLPILGLAAGATLAAVLIIKSWEQLELLWANLQAWWIAGSNAIIETTKSWGANLHTLFWQAWDGLIAVVKGGITTAGENNKLGLDAILVSNASGLTKMQALWAAAWSGVINIVQNGINGVLNDVDKLLSALSMVGGVENNPTLTSWVNGLRTWRAAGGADLSKHVRALGDTVASYVTPKFAAWGAVISDVGMGVQLLTQEGRKLTTQLGTHASDAFGELSTEAGKLIAELTKLFSLPPPFAGDRDDEGINWWANIKRPPMPDMNEDTDKGFPPVGGDDAGKALENARKKAEELWRDLVDALAKEAGEAKQKIQSIYEKAFEGMGEALLKAHEDMQKAEKEWREKVETAATERGIREDAERRRKALDDRLDAEARARAIRLDNEEVFQARQLEDLENALDDQRELREKAFEAAIDAEDRARDLIREDEDRAYDKSQEALESALDARLDAEKEALDKAHDLRSDALERDQDAREAALDAELDAEERRYETAKDLAEINTEVTRDTAEAQAEYAAEIARGVKKSIAQARLDEKLSEIAKKASEDRLGVADETAEAEADLAFEATQAARRTALQAKFDTERLTLKAQFEAEVTAIELKAEAERIAEKERLEVESLKRSRARAEEDRLYDLSQGARVDANVENEDKQALEAQRVREDAARQRRRELDEKDRLYGVEQEIKRRALEKELEAEDVRRQDAKMLDEYNKEIANIQKILDEEQRRVRKQLAQDIVDFKANLEERVTAVRREYVDKLQDAMEDAEGTIGPLVDRITNHMEEGLLGIRDAAIEATGRLIEAFQAAEALSMATSASERAAAFASLDTKQYGGIVGGPFGSKQIIEAHGGERFEGMGSQGTALSAVRAAETMWRSGIGAGQTVNNYNYSVEANYGRVQPEGSVGRDLSALVALTQR